ncbi:40S ribosomal protein S5-1 [Hordeum vulgare]|nr:40S ribosomal protein S5-1 [Hordeum vulgare]
MSEEMLHIRDVEGPKKTRSVETRLEAMEQQVFKCQGMVECGLNANHMMITEFTNKQKMDANDIGKHLSTLYDRVDQLQGQIYDLQNQNCLPEDEVKKKFFPLSLKDQALTWYRLCDDTRSWDYNRLKLEPMHLVHRDRNYIYNFWPRDKESIAQA